MQRPSRPQNLSDPGSWAVKEIEDSGVDPRAVGAAGASAQTPRANECGEQISTRGEEGGGGKPNSPSWDATHAKQGAIRNRAESGPCRRPSSGYISGCESLPSSPLSPAPVTADKATQTASLTGQVMTHALTRMTQSGGPGMRQQHGLHPDPAGMRQGNGASAMRDKQFGRDLQLIGDDYNRLLLLRRAAMRRRPAAIPVNLLPQQYPPVALLCVSVLLLFIGRMMYLRSGTNDPDHSQV